MSDNQKWCPDAAFGARCVLPLDHEPDTHYYARDAANRDGWTPTQIRPEETNVTWCVTNGVASGRACFLPEGHKGAHIYTYGRAIDHGWTPDQLRPEEANVTWGQPFDAQPSRCPRTVDPFGERCALPKGHTEMCALIESGPDSLPLAEPRCGLLLTDPEPDGPFTCELDDNHSGACSGDRVVPQFPGPETMERIVTELNKTFGPVEVPLTAAELRAQSEDRAARIHRLEQALQSDKQSLAQVGETNRVLRRKVGELQSALKEVREESGDLSERNTELCRELGHVREAAATSAAANRDLSERNVALAKRNMQMEQELSEAQVENDRLRSSLREWEEDERPAADHSEDHSQCHEAVRRFRLALNALLDD